MKCPNCDETLVMAERQGVEIDYCPKCRGIWLDKGELDKIIEKSLREEQGSRDYYKDDHKEYDDNHHDGHNYGTDYKRKKKRGFLSNFFEFD